MSRAGTLIAAAILAGALYLAGAIALGSPPAAADSGAQVVAWFREHQDAARFFAWTATLGTIGAATLLGLGARPAIPRWLTLIGMVAIAEQAIETVTVFGSDGFIAPGGPMNLLLGAGLTALWFAALVVWAVGRLRAGRVAAA